MNLGRLGELEYQEDLVEEVEAGNEENDISSHLVEVVLINHLHLKWQQLLNQNIPDTPALTAKESMNLINLQVHSKTTLLSKTQE